MTRRDPFARARFCPAYSRFSAVPSVLLLLATLLATPFPSVIPSADAGVSTYYWDGGGDGSSWGDPWNWDQNMVPESGSDVVIDPGYGAQVYLYADTWIETLIIGQTSSAALFINGCTLYIGSTELTISYGGEVHVENGGTLSTGIIHNEGHLVLNGGSVGLVDSQGRISALGSGNTIQQLQNQPSGEINVFGRADTDNGHLVINSGDLNLAQGILRLTNDGGLANATLQILTGYLISPAGSTIQLSGGPGVRVVGATGIHNYGVMDIDQPLIAVPLLSFFNGGVMLCDASVQIQLGNFANSGQLYIAQGTEFHVDDGAVTLQGQVLGGGRLVASISPVFAGGTIEPGAPGETGDFFIDGSDVTHDPQFRLIAEIGGQAPLMVQDRLVMSNGSNLDGTLEIHLVNGFVPLVGQSFEVLSCAGNLVGTFSSYVGLTQNGVSMVPVYGSHGLSLVVTNVSGVGDEAPAGELTFSARSGAAGAEFRVSLPWDGRMEITVFDLQGRQIGAPRELELAAGVHETTWDSRRLGSGVYFARLSARPAAGDHGSIQRTARFTLVR